MGDLWLEVLAFFGDREARKTLNRRRGARKAAVTRRTKRGMDSSVVLSSSMAVRLGDARPEGTPITESTNLYEPDARD